MVFSGKSKKVICLAALTTILSLWYDAEITGGLFKTLTSRTLSLNLGNGMCEWVAAIQWTDVGFPSDANFTKTIVAGYPSGDKRVAYLQMEGLTGLSARDEWEFAFLAHTNQPFIKANYPHHEGIWGWGNAGDQVMLIVSDLRKVLVEYHDILWDIGYAQTFEEAYERIENLYREERPEDDNPPVEDFLVWRDLRAFDEIHWYSWFIDYYMEGGLMRDMFNHELTTPPQWHMAILPNFFTKFEVRHGRFVHDNETEYAAQDNYDPMCATLSKGCYPVLAIDPEKLVDSDYGPAEARKIAELVNGTQGFEDWMIEEEAWECIWNELINNGKGTKTFMDRTINYDSYVFSFEMKNEMWHQINRLIEKYEVQEDQVAIDVVEILRGHRDGLGIDQPADPLSYEELMSYHLAFPPFFPNQKMFKSDDDFFVRVHEKFDPAIQDYESIIDRRRAWFEEEMERKRERKIQISYYEAPGWSSLPDAGLASLTPYDTGTTYSINYKRNMGDFAGSGRESEVAALFQGYIYIDPLIKKLCVTSDDGSRVYLDDQLRIDNNRLQADHRECCDVTDGVYKFDLEYFELYGGATLVLEFGPSMDNLRVVPPRSWASQEGQRRYRELMRLNDLLEEDLKILEETDFMGPATRAEFNRRRKAKTDSVNPTVNEEGRKLIKDALKDFSNFDEIRALPKKEQLKIMRSVFGG